MTEIPKPRGSYAVMAQRREPPDALDDFPTPPWGTRALIEQLRRRGAIGDPALDTGWEPAANRGYMVRPLRESFGAVFASDVFDYGCGFDVFDFLGDRGLFGGSPVATDWIVTNPPFNAAAAFARIALARARRGVALLCRLAFTESGGRYEELFLPSPPTAILQFVERLIIYKGRVLDPAKDYWDDRAGAMKKPSSATAYAWFVWQRGAGSVARGGDSAFGWIPPCRQRLERPGDYDLPTRAP